jgi:protein O-mannosyl-transferase
MATQKNNISKKTESVKKKTEPIFNEKGQHKKVILFFMLACFLLYGKAITNDYSMDDEFVVRNNMQVQKGIKAIPEIFRTTYVIDSQKASYEYRPMVKAVYAIECQLFGVNPHVSHFFNILLYALSIILLYYILKDLLSNYNIILPFIITTLFLIHPLHSEVVISIKNRDVMLSFIGCLLALKFYIKFVATNKYYHLFLGAFFILFALMSKKDAMTYLAVIPFTLWFFKNVPYKKLGLIVLTYIFSMAIFKIASKSVHQEVSRTFLQWENPLYLDTTILQRIPTGLYSIYFYIKMFFIPYPLISYYGYNQVPIATWSNPIVWLVLLFLFAIAYYVVKKWREKRIEIFGILYFFITISMFTNVLIPVVGIVGERFAFIPSLGLSIVAAVILLKLFKIVFTEKEVRPSFSNSFYITAGIIVIAFSTLSFSRISAWKDSYTLYATDVKTATESAHIHSLFAAASVQKVKENPRMAIEDKKFHIANALKGYKESLRIIPDYVSALNNVGMVYYTFYNKPEESIPYLKKAISLDTNYVEAYFNLATCEGKSNQKEAAEKHFLKTIEINPKFFDTYSSLSALYAEDKRYDKIVALNQGAIDKGLKSATLYISLGNVYYMQGDTTKSIPYFESSIAIDSNNKALNSFLADYFKKKGDLEKANHYYDLVATSKR